METNDETIDPHGTEDGLPVVAGLPGAGGAAADKPDFRASEDGNQVEFGGRKYVREEALHGERTRAQGYAKTLQALEPLMPEFEEFLETKRGGRAATVDRATRSGGGAVDTGDYSEDELTGYAITRGYYGEDQKPDVRRAKADLDIMTAIADRRAGRAVRPLAEGTARDRAMRNTSQAMAQTFVDGQPIADPQYLKAAFDAVPDEIKADPNVSNILTVVAAGLQALDDRRTGRGRNSRREPAFREGGGSRVDRQTDSLDALDRAAARARGKTDEQWAKTQKTVTGSAGFGGTILEDI